MIPRPHLISIAVLILLGVGFGALFYDRLPDPAPTHWNFRGEADDFGPRWELAFGVPLVLVVLTALLIVLPRLGPFRANFQRFRTVYGRIAVTLVVGLLAVHVVLVLKGAGRPIQMGAAMSIIFGLLLAVLGNWMGKVRRNFYVGIRTPWTLANDMVWERTHRVGGYLMVASGLVVAAVGALATSDRVCVYVAIGWIVLMVGWALVYSYLTYRRLGEVDELPVANDET